VRRSLPLLALPALLALLTCTPAAPPSPPPLEAPPLDAAATAPLALQPGSVVELSVSADGRAGARLATPSGSERFLIILASTRLDASAPPVSYTVSLSAAEPVSRSERVDGCALSQQRFASTALPTDPPPRGTPPRPGASRSLRVPTQGTSETIEARAISVGEHAVIWADTTHPTSLDQAFVLQFRDDFEHVILPRARQVFGTEPDLDHDGRIQLVFTSLTRESGVAFFSACDLAEHLAGCTGSNHGEYLYLTPPDAIAPPYNTPNAIKEILAHEVAHLLHFQRKVLRNQLSSWQDGVYLSEGIGALAQDVTGYQAGNLYVTRAALDGIDQFSLSDVLHTPAASSPATEDRKQQGILRGGGYLFVRYLYDRAGGDRAHALEIENAGGPSLLRAWIDAPIWLDQALPRIASADLASLTLDFYTALALSNREQAGGVPATNGCFRYLPTRVDPITQKQRGADLFARFHGSQMQGPKLGDARAADEALLPGGVEYLTLDASIGKPELPVSIRVDPASAPRVRLARLQ
jgi:hypothetical protein